MTDRVIDCPHGSIEISINLATTRDGNKALTEAKERAVFPLKAL